MTSTGRPLRNRDAARIPAVRPSGSGSPARVYGPSRFGPRMRRLGDRVPRAWAVGGGVAGLLLLAIAVAIEPRSSDPAAIPSLIDTLFMTVLLVALHATALGLAARRRAGFAASLVFAGVFLGAVLLCPVTGHHELGSWWYGQLASVGGLIALGVVGLRRAPPVAE